MLLCLMQFLIPSEEVTIQHPVVNPAEVPNPPRVDPRQGGLETIDEVTEPPSSEDTQDYLTHEDPELRAEAARIVKEILEGGQFHGVSIQCLDFAALRLKRIV